MRWRGVAYFGAVFVIASGVVASFVMYPNQEALVVATGNWLLSLLTYPLGFVATALSMALIYLGIATPSEALFASFPIYVALGYMQWFSLLPALYRRRG